MKKIALLTVLLGLSLNAFCQGTFSEKTFYDLAAEYAKDLEGFVKNADENFVFITGNGARMYKPELAKIASTITLKREYSDIKVNQSGGTALVSGIIDETITPKDDPSKERTYKGVFTGVWSYQKGKWVLMSWQHSDYRPGN